MTNGWSTPAAGFTSMRSAMKHFLSAPSLPLLGYGPTAGTVKEKEKKQNDFLPLVSGRVSGEW
jgi:hypothetical protein